MLVSDINIYCMKFELEQKVQRKVFSVSELTTDLKTLLEDNFVSIWIKGEISNFKTYASGHHYFTLKDEKAQISCVMFKGHNRLLKFNIEDGLAVVIHGRLSVYEVRGQYQIIVDQMQPDGIGALQLAYDQLKEKLLQEGLFDAERKRKLPTLPTTIGIITSLHGAAIHDMMNVARRRYPNINIRIYPVKVQGEGSVEEIVTAINYMSENLACDVLIVGRGGGSLEDLWSFNEESVVRAMAQSRIPTISAVGHETDFCLCDFAADMRAPTPSAAAELAVPLKDIFETQRQRHQQQIMNSMNRSIETHRRNVRVWLKSIPTPLRVLDNLHLRLADLEDRMTQNMLLGLRNRRMNLSQYTVQITSPKQILLRLGERVTNFKTQLTRQMLQNIKHIQLGIQQHKIKLQLLSPESILKRGFVIAKSTTGSVIGSAHKIPNNQELQLMFHDGVISAKTITAVDSTKNVN